MLKSSLGFLLCILVSFVTNAQNPQWLIQAGGTSEDAGMITKVAPNGNIVVGGYFRNTIDLDPSSGTYNITSFSNTQDMFLACYTPAGALIWGFPLGREDYDAISTIAIDNSNNIYIGGFFRGNNVDFDPSSGTTTLTCNGFTGGGSSTYGGDGFVAKYSSAGAFQWVLQLGTPYWVESVESLAIDNGGNVLVGGIFKDVLDFDPSSGTTNLDANTNGTAFLAKYTANKQLLWAFNFGKSGIAATDNIVQGITVDNNNDIYIAGFVQSANNIDFDPSSNTVNLVPNGPYDGFVAKYTSAGAYVFAFLIGGAGVDVFNDIASDNSGNIYVTGYANATSLDLDPSSSTATATAQGGGENIMLASYSSTGQYRWGKLIGNSGADHGRRLTVSGNSVLVTGWFSNTVDFNQGGSSSANQSSNGNTDIFVSRYSLTGNYECSFGAGSGGADMGYGITTDASGFMYISGAFAGSNVDFDPGTNSMAASSNGGTDIYVVKYEWGGVGGYLVGDTVCDGEQAYLTYVETGGPTNITISYTDGTNNYSKNVQNGVPFALTPNPTTITNYSLTSTNLCASTTGPGPATVLVNANPTANAGADTNICGTTSLTLQGTGGGTYAWTSTQTITNPNSPTPTVSGTVSGTYRLVVTNASGCSDTDDVDVTVLTTPVANAGPDMTICPTSLIQLHGSGGLNYFWYSTVSILTPNVQDPIVHGNKSGTFYMVASNGIGCNDTDEVNITVMPQPTAYAGNDTTVCPHTEIELKGTVSGNKVTSKWVSTASITDPDSLQIKVTIDSGEVFFLVAVDSIGCSDTSIIQVSIQPVPDFKTNLEKTDLCKGETLTLTAKGGGTYNWWSAGFSSTDSSISVAPATDVTYNVAIKGPLCNYSDTLSVPVTIRPLPNVQVTKSNDISCTYTSAALTASGALNYSWVPGYGLDKYITEQVNASPDKTTTYRVTGVNEYGCKATADVEIDVKSANDIALSIPNAFSPNNDGHNDCYRVQSNFDFHSYSIQINNRRGQAVFKSENIMDCWDGRYKGVESGMDTYYYYIKIKTDACGDIIKKGDILLVR